MGKTKKIGIETNSLENKLKGKCKKNQIKLPSGIIFLEHEEEIEMILKDRAIGKGNPIINMQENEAAFEGWAVILYRYFNKNIKLDVDVELGLGDFEEKFDGSGHYNRFLYRTLRFKEQYSWFSLSEKLEKVISAEGGFKDWLKENKEKLINNVPQGEASTLDQAKKSENWVEGELSGKESALYCVIENSTSNRNEIFRQLPVGLFKDKVDAKNGVFARKKAAIDLWTWNKEKFYIFELKYENKMVGIITELFFYANYLYDLLIEKNFKLNRKNVSERGYDYLLKLENEFQEICAYMVADLFHPLIDEEVLEILNMTKNNIKIKYAKYTYKLEMKVKMVLNNDEDR